MFGKLKTSRSIKEEGFTLIELMIVVVIIGILAAVAIPIFANQQKAAIDAQTVSHRKQLIEAIDLARVSTSQTLIGVTKESCTRCRFPNGSEPLDLPKTHTGWVIYERTLDRISVASGMDVRGLTDGFGRPFSIDENENEVSPTSCTRDIVGLFEQSVVFPNARNYINLSYYSSHCLR